MAVPADALMAPPPSARSSTSRSAASGSPPLPARPGPVKLAAAEANGELGLLDPDVARPSRRRRSRWPRATTTTSSRSTSTRPAPDLDQHEHERGHRATSLARLGGSAVHPNDDVNRCQSSNDTIPTALQLSAAVAIEEACSRPRRLHTALVAKAQEFWPVVKTGRTHLQDATPIRLGQEFRGYAGQVEEAIRCGAGAQAELLAVPLGGTAVGTGINAHPEYAARTCARLTGADRPDVRETANHFHAQATLDAAIAAHGAIRTIALALWKIASTCADGGWGRGGPRRARLPETQPGSSIMPGKVNPVIVESLTMVVARVVATTPRSLRPDGAASSSSTSCPP